MSILVRILAIAAVCAASAPMCAFAEKTSATVDPSEALIKEGIELRRLGDDQAALPKFEKAYEGNASARAAAQLGLCELALGRFAAAVPHLTQALHQRGDKWVESNRGVLRDALEQAKAKVARLEVSGDPEGATLLINGRTVGNLPLQQPVLVNEGTVDVELTKPGFAAERRQVVVQGGQFQSIVLRLTALAPEPKQPDPAAESISAAVSSEPPPAATPGAWLRPVKWTTLGLAAAGLGVGVFGWQRHQSLVGDFDAQSCRVDRSGNAGMLSGERLVGSAACSDKLSSINSAGTLRTVGLISGGAFLTAFVVLHFVGAKESEVSQAQYSCLPGIFGVACGGVF